MEASILQSVDISVARLGSLIGVSAKVGVTLYEHRGVHQHLGDLG
jgi:hypothetical protein